MRTPAYRGTCAGFALPHAQEACDRNSLNVQSPSSSSIVAFAQQDGPESRKIARCLVRCCETTENIPQTPKVCSVAVFFLLVFAALGPAKCIARSGLGWQIDRFVGYFALTLTFGLVWRRPLVVGGALMALAMLLEGLQAFTPDRHADLYAAMISASGAMAAVLPADFFIQTLRRRTLLRLECALNEPAARE